VQLPGVEPIAYAVFSCRTDPNDSIVTAADNKSSKEVNDERGTSIKLSLILRLIPLILD
jgi:hypothetical protein